MKKIKNMSTESLTKLFTYVALITLAISIIIPIGWVFFASLKTNAEFYASPWALPKSFHWQNFVDAFEKAKMGEYLITSVFVTAVALLILLVVALPAAYVIARFEFRGRKAINSLFMSGLFINVNYIVIPIFLMLLSWNRIGQQMFGKDIFINNPLVLAVVYAATALPFTIYLLSGFFQTLPSAYEEAAMIDGCSYSQTMTKIMIPMAKPSIITIILFNFLSFWNEYIISLTLLSGKIRTLPVGLINLQAAARGGAQPGILYAGLVIVMLPTLILYIFVQKKLTEGMTLGGLKD